MYFVVIQKRLVQLRTHFIILLYTQKVRYELYLYSLNSHAAASNSADLIYNWHINFQIYDNTIRFDLEFFSTHQRKVHYDQP